MKNGVEFSDYWPHRCDNNNKDEVNSPNILITIIDFHQRNLNDRLGYLI